MATVLLDQADGAAVTSGPSGDTLTRQGRVLDLNVAPHLLLVAALNEPGVPQRGDALDPAYPWMVCTNIQGRVIANNVVVLDFTYANRTERDAYDISIPPINNNGAAQRSTSWQRLVRTVTEDEHGYGQDFVLQPPAAHAGELPQVAEVEFIEWVMVYVFRRTEVDPPVARGRDLIGHVNQFAVSGIGARQLLCQQYTSDTVSGSRWFDVVAEFAYRPLGWDEVYTWRRADGRDPGGHDANSRKKLKHLPERTFGDLNFDFS